MLQITNKNRHVQCISFRLLVSALSKWNHDYRKTYLLILQQYFWIKMNFVCLYIVRSKYLDKQFIILTV